MLAYHLVKIWVIIAVNISAISFYNLRPEPWIVGEGQAVLAFDLDHTLYPRTGTNSNYRKSVLKYIQQHAGVGPEEANEIFFNFRNDYDALVVRGLINTLSINGQDFEDYIDSHSNLHKTLHPDPKLRSLLAQVKVPRIVFTNSGMYPSSCLISLHIDYNL